jgi:hypothetical protein
MAAAAFFHAPADGEADGGWRDWDAYCAAAFEAPPPAGDEFLNDLADGWPPLLLGDGIVDLEPRSAGRPAAFSDPPRACRPASALCRWRRVP